MVFPKFIPELTVRRAEVFVFRAPIETPVQTLFGTMLDRPSVLVRLEDADGVHGWGKSGAIFLVAVPSTVRALPLKWSSP